MTIAIGTPEGEHRYSPSEVVATEVVPVIGRPDPNKMGIMYSTSETRRRSVAVCALHRISPSETASGLRG